MAIISAKSLLEAGVHFGHKASRWNPKMAPYIFGKRNLIHIINLRETIRGLIRAYHFLSKIAAEGREVLFVGTKRQAKNVVKQAALRCGMHYVTERWLGGTLTNYETIRKRLTRLEELEAMATQGIMDSLSKKRGSALRREQRKIQRNLEGIRNMSKLPGALVIIDPNKEKIALREAAKLDIPTICLIDTDSDPNLVDIPIPGNDDAMRSIEIICNKLAEAISEGRAKWEAHQKIESKKNLEEGQTTAGKERAEKSDRRDKRGEGHKKDYRKKGRRRNRGERSEDSRRNATEASAQAKAAHDTADKKARPKREYVKDSRKPAEKTTSASDSAPATSTPASGTSTTSSAAQETSAAPSPASASANQNSEASPAPSTSETPSTSEAPSQSQEQSSVATSESTSQGQEQNSTAADTTTAPNQKSSASDTQPEAEKNDSSSS